MEVAGFDWDRGNRTKCQKHGVAIEAIESLFTGPVAIFPDDAHSEQEQRFRAVGWTKDNRAVFVVFTLRRQDNDPDGDLLIRPISARYMHKKEIETYEKANPDLQE
jgi:uncharacterized DUF497 family protein